MGLALALPSNSKTWLEKVSKDKPSTLLGLIISDEGKMFYNIDTRSKSSKTHFYSFDTDGRGKIKLDRFP